MSEQEEMRLSRVIDKLRARVAELEAENVWLSDRLHDTVNTCYGGVTHAEIDARRAG